MLAECGSLRDATIRIKENRKHLLRIFAVARTENIFPLEGFRVVTQQLLEIAKYPLLVIVARLSGCVVINAIRRLAVRKLAYE